MEAGKDSLSTDDQADRHDELDKEQIPPADSPLEHRYSVWAMMKQQMQQDASYSSANKIVASFGTVSDSNQLIRLMMTKILVNSLSKSC